MTFLKLPTRLKASLTVLLSSVLLTACSSGLLDPKGAIGEQNKALIIFATLLMLIVVIPVIIMAVWFTYRYRADRPEPDKDFEPNWAHNIWIESLMWGIPIILIIILAVVTWQSTHDIDPYKPLEAGTKGEPVRVNVVAQNWKWLFIYPDQKIAAVNELYIPVDREISFDITSDSVMNSFFIPRLGSQIYAMARMVTKLHLIANEPGVYNGLSSNYSGPGFSDMKFLVHAVNDQQFNDWVDKVRSPSHKTLNVTTYEELAKPSENHPIEYFKSIQPGIFKYIVHQYEDKSQKQNQFVHQGEIIQRDNTSAVSPGLGTSLDDDGQGTTNPAAPTNRDDAQEDDAQ